MKIQIVIPAINLWSKYTQKCIESIKTKHEHRILLIDNASDDETMREAGKLVSNTFAHKRNQDRWGCAKSWNFGINDAFERGYDYVLVLNNDVLLHPDAIDRLVERFEEAERKRIALTPSLQKAIEDLPNVPDIKEIPESDILGMVTMVDIRVECQSIPEYLFDKKSADYETGAEAEHPNFSGFMLSKKCWDKVGEFDEGFAPAYFEDNDYHRRIKVAGMKAISYPPSLFYHYGSRTRVEVPNQPVTHTSFEKNRQYFVGKWGGMPGQEQFGCPFGNPINTVKWTKQKHG